MKQGKTAIVVGATGLVGSELVRQLLADAAYGRVVTLQRREMKPLGPGHEPHTVDFEARAAWAPLVSGDALFSAMGTTLKVAGSQAAQYRIDHDYQLWAMQAAAQNGVPNVVLISSTGADPKSRAFYTRMKGELEVSARQLGLANLVILRPGILDGPRQQRRTAEQLALKVLRAVPKAPALAKLRPVHASIVARACRFGAEGTSAQDREGEGGPDARVFEAADIFKYGETAP